MQSKSIFVEQYDLDNTTGTITIWHDGTTENRAIEDFAYYCHRQGLYTLGSKMAAAKLTLSQMPSVAIMIINNWVNEEAIDDIFSGPDVTEVDLGPIQCDHMYQLPEAALPPGVKAGSYEHQLYNRFMESHYGSYQENHA